MKIKNTGPIRRLERRPGPRGGDCHFPGHDFSGALTFVHERGDTIVLHIAGGHFWSGIGVPQSYSPASYFVGRVLSRDGDDSMLVEELVDFPVSRKLQRQERG